MELATSSFLKRNNINVGKESDVEPIGLATEFNNKPSGIPWNPQIFVQVYENVCVVTHTTGKGTCVRKYSLSQFEE